MVHPSTGLIREIERQLAIISAPSSLSALDGVEKLSQQDKEGDYFKHLSILHTTLSAHPRRGDPKLPDDTLLWRIPAFCSQSESFFPLSYWRARCEPVRALRVQREPVTTNTESIWRDSHVHAWTTATQSSLLLLRGSSSNRKCLETFGLELIDYLEENDQQPVYLPNIIASGSGASAMNTNIGALEALRQVAIQSLQKSRQRKAPFGFLDTVVERFQTTRTCEDWVKVLKLVFQSTPSLFVVLDLGILGGNYEAAHSWPFLFQGILDELQTESSSNLIKVAMLTSTSPASIPTGAHVVNLPGQTPLSPEAMKRALKAQHLQKRRQNGDSRPSIYVHSYDDTPIPCFNTTAGPPTLDQGGPPGDAAPAVGQPVRPTSRHSIEIAIICALPLEADAIHALFDRHWDDDGLPFEKAPGDTNAYSVGVIGHHNVILLHMPGMGKVNAARMAASCRASFVNIKLALLVGICGAIPFGPGGEEIILGDVIISEGVIQYDIGRQFPDKFVRKSALLESLGRPNPELGGLLSKLKGLRGLKLLSRTMLGYMETLRQEPLLSAQYPGAAKDILFESDYLHIGEKSCEGIPCNGNPVLRRRLQQERPDLSVHFGLIASGDKVMKSGQERDAIAEAEGIIAFEMEGAGIWDSFPCLVIKGVCDYADSHKSKTWQRYAAATAAACAKAFLSHWAHTSHCLE